MNKESYVKAEMEIVVFTAEDIIATSALDEYEGEIIK